MEDFISVIIPVYNVESYIRSCVESVLVQTYSAFEAILIEDGSTDNSLPLCETLCREDPRIRLIQQEHKGVSAARNLGIEAAKGKYLFFLDSDDMIHPQLLETLYQLMETEHTTMATEGLHYGKAGVRPKAGGWKIRTDCPPRSFYLENKKAFKYFYKSILGGVGGKMIRRRAICSLRFKEDLSQGEDTLFIYQLLAGGADVSVLCCNWYYYRMHKRNASKDLSIAACRSKYKVERYICDSEMRSGRKENAIGKEWYILETMTAWYETGRRCRNAAFMKYTKNLIKAERRLKIFRQLCCWMKLYYYSFLYCYPFSKIILKVERTAWKICDSSKRYIKSQ